MKLPEITPCLSAISSDQQRVNPLNASQANGRMIDERGTRPFQAYHNSSAHARLFSSLRILLIELVFERTITDPDDQASALALRSNNFIFRATTPRGESFHRLMEEAHDQTRTAQLLILREE
jgi:hypothetical protein